MVAWLKVSINTNPGNSQGKPPPKKNLESSNIVKQLARNMLLKKIFWLNCINLTTAKGAMNKADNSIPINIIIEVDIIMLVFP